MNTDHLTLFCSVAEIGSIAGAARARGIDPSTVSRAISALETALGCRLFQRSTRRLALTEAGRRYLERVAPLIAELERANADITAETAAPSGRIRLGASVSFGQTMLVPLLPAFAEALPDMQLDLVLSDENTNLVEAGLDMSIRLAPSVEGDLICSRLMPTRYRVVAAPAYLDRAGWPTAPAAITGHDVVQYTLPAFQDQWHFRGHDGVLESVPLPAPRFRFSHANSLRDGMAAGLGLALMADYLIGDMPADGRCVDVFPDHDVTATSFDTAAWIVYPSRAFMPAKTRATIDFLHQHLRPGTNV